MGGAAAAAGATRHLSALRVDYGNHNVSSLVAVLHARPSVRGFSVCVNVSMICVCIVRVYTCIRRVRVLHTHAVSHAFCGSDSSLCFVHDFVLCHVIFLYRSSGCMIYIYASPIHCVLFSAADTRMCISD